ncbi:MAG: RNA 2',3'-cyclic phosphodiesterase [Candidatus Woesearchaeota archaeon]|nr:RNA 2',3'-cyclic phosphodiesterase [Candidatus Woesearchaeota archaeon]
MRLFIAFDASKAKEQILAIQKQLTGATLTKSFHLTLKFLGEVTPAKAEEIKNKLKTVQFKPFTAKLNGTGVFPNENFIRVVWIGLEPKETICELQKKIEEALHGMFEKEKDFQPHITLARVKSSDQQFADKVKNLKVEPVSFAVKEFKLIESKLEREGPVYTDVEKYEMK